MKGQPWLVAPEWVIGCHPHGCEWRCLDLERTCVSSDYKSHIPLLWPLLGLRTDAAALSALKLGNRNLVAGSLPLRVFLLGQATPRDPMGLVGGGQVLPGREASRTPEGPAGCGSRPCPQHMGIPYGSGTGHH